MTSSRPSAWSRLVTLTRPLFRSEYRWRAVGALALLLSVLLVINRLNVRNNEVVGRFMTAVEQRHAGLFFQLALLNVGLFVALTVLAVFARFIEERLGLHWRDWLTRFLLGRYLNRHAYYHMEQRGDVDNPDQRIAEDVKTFTTHTLTFLLIGVNSTFTLVSFSAILWSITPWLFAAAVGYAAFGSLTTVLLGRRLVKYDVVQYKKEADFRYDLIQVRTQAEAIALRGGEAAEKARLLRRLDALVANFRQIVSLNRNVGFFTVGFDYMAQLIPTFIVAPLYMSGRVEFGAIAQAAMAFSFVMNSFSLIVKEFQRISTFGAVIERLGLAWEVIEQETDRAGKSAIEMETDPDRLAYDRLTLVTPRDGRVLVKELSAEVPAGQRLLITGRHGAGRTALLRATAGLWTAGQGHIVRPPTEDVLFLPQQPYLGPGSLRDLLGGGRSCCDEELRPVLHRAGLDALVERMGGLDVECEWDRQLSLGERQLLAFARLLLARPRFAFLDEATSALDAHRAQVLYQALAHTPSAYVSVANDLALLPYHDSHLELGEEGAWALTPPAALAVSA